MGGERPVFTPPHILPLSPLCTQLEAWHLVSEEGPAPARHPLGCMQAPELKGQHWEVTQRCLHCRALPSALLSRCGPPAPSKLARDFQVASWRAVSWVQAELMTGQIGQFPRDLVADCV